MYTDSQENFKEQLPVTQYGYGKFVLVSRGQILEEYSDKADAKQFVF